MEKTFREKKSYRPREKSEENSSKEEGKGNQEIFLRNLNYSTTESELKSFFKKYGDVIRVKILQADGKSKGSGFVQFKSSRDASDVIKDADNLEIDGKKVSASWANQKGGNSNNYSAKPNRDRSRSRENSYPKKQNSRGNESSSYSKDPVFTIFVGNLGFKTRENKIKEFFSDCGKVSNVRIGLNEDGRSRGFCHVDFDSKDAIKAALEKNGVELDGRNLRIDQGRPQASSNNSEYRRR